MTQNLKRVLAAWAIITIATAATCFLTGLVAGWFGIVLPPQPSLDAVLNSHGWYLATNIALIVMIMPIVEEAVFRWLLFKLPSKLTGRFLVGRGVPPSRPPAGLIIAIASSILFSAAHYIQMPFPNNAFVALFLFGVLQCRLYRQTNAIWCPILTHALFNATNLALLFLFPDLAKMT